jgi:serine protease AprX
MGSQAYRCHARVVSVINWRGALGVSRYRIVVALLILALFASASLSPAGLSAQQQGPPIRLKAATFAPTRGEAPAIPPGLTQRGYAEGQRGYYLVQFTGPIEQAWRDELAAAGAEILAYVPEFAFKVRMNPAEARQVERLGNVGWVGLFHPGYKLSPSLARDGARVYTVRVESGADAGQAAAAIARSGATILGREEQMLMVAADAAQLDAIAQVLDVAWVQNFMLREKHNEAGAGVIMGSNTANASGYDGSTQTVAVADTGLGDGTAAGAPPDIKERVTTIYNWPGAAGGCFTSVSNDGAQDVDSGHGTHVSGSVLGAGDATGKGRGTAPAAKLVFQATENWVTISGLCKAIYGYSDGYYLTGIPNDLRTLFQQAYDAGARIHSNSWGSAVAGDYTLDSANADDFVWTHRDMTVTFSAGNEGADANSDGKVDNDSIGSPATAKNVITVGASENDRGGSYPCDTTLGYRSSDAYQKGDDGTSPTCAEMGGNNRLGTGGSRWGFSTEPLKSDPTAGNQEQMAHFSSRGPTDDGRIKPDVVAPGTWILSTYSGQFQEGYGDPANPKNGAYQWDGWGMPLNGAYKWMGGTSMSNPLVAGAAAVVRDFYQAARGVAASAALVKATLINSAVDMQDENNDGANDNDFPIPNNHEGWGRVNVANATDGSRKFVEQTTGLGTNGTKSYQASVNAAGALKVTLVWSDYASTETASKNLVNDLDLVVTSPSGTVVYRGNAFSGGWSATGGTADRTNNVENVYIQSAVTGTWTVEVKGYNVPNGPQPFALVVAGAASVAEGTTPPPPPPTVPAAPTGLTATAVSKSQINLAWSDKASNESGFKIERSTNATTGFTEIATVGPNVSTYSNTGLSRNTTYYYRVRAYNADGDSVYSNTASATTPRK